MKKLIFLCVLVVLLTACVPIPSSSPVNIPVTTDNISYAEKQTIEVGESRKVKVIQGAMWLEEEVNRWLEQHPDNKIISITAVPLNDRYGATLVVIVYE